MKLFMKSFILLVLLGLVSSVHLGHLCNSNVDCDSGCCSSGGILMMAGDMCIEANTKTSGESCMGDCECLTGMCKQNFLVPVGSRMKCV
jgi:hypothetical protein